MKRAAAFCILLACSGLLLGAPDPANLSRERAPLLRELVRMTRAGSSKEAVLAYAKAHRLELPPEVSDDNLRWLREQGVSEMVVQYMTAVDVRAADESGQEAVPYGSREVAPPTARYSRPDNSDENYSDSSYGSYADNYPGYPADYDYGGYPFYDYPYYDGWSYPYPVYVFVDRHGFIRRFHGPIHRFGGRDGFRGRDGFHRGRGFGGPRGFADPRLPRGFAGRRGSVVVAPRRSGRPASPPGGFRAGFSPPRGTMIGRGGFGNRSFPGGGPSSGGFGRGTIGHFGGRSGPAGSFGGRGMR